jgi:DNA polymerase-3 subunit gamma/tau
VFENLLGQSVSGQLIQDIETGVLAPAMLFTGQTASGKGTAALELARVISCESGAETGKAPWGCTCSACARHRLLLHPDLLCLGWKPFSQEIAASAKTFLLDAGNASSRLLFIRSVRKLLARFNPVLWEDEPKAKTLSPLVNSLEECLDELDSLTNTSLEDPSDKSLAALSKLVEGMIKNSFKLESDGLSESIPIAQLRRAAYWSRIAPHGREKLLVIENAGRMQEGAQNSLLKLLEEPPGRSRYVLCAVRPGTLPSTILSRLRPYRFSSRGAAVEAEVIRRVFKCQGGEGGIGAYLDSFLPVSPGVLEALAAFFTASVAYKAALLSKRDGHSISDEVVLLGKSSASKTEAAGMGRPKGDSAAVIALVLEKAEKFEVRSLFSRFLFYLLEQISASQKNSAVAFTPAFHETWRECCNWAESAVGVYNLRPTQALEKLFSDLSQRLAKLSDGSAL